MRTHLLATAGVAALLAAMSAQAQTITGGVAKQRSRATGHSRARHARGRRGSVLVAASTATLALLAATSSTHAQTNWTGAVSTNWFTAGNWDAGVPTVVTNANIDTVSANPTVVATPGGTALNLAVGQSGTGILTIQSGGTVFDISGAVANSQGSQGTVTVSGAGSTWTNMTNVVVGGQGTGTLTIQNGGMVNSAIGGSVGLAVGSSGTVTVTGPGSSWNNSPGGVLIGAFGTAALTVADGGTVTSGGLLSWLVTPDRSER